MEHIRFYKPDFRWLFGGIGFHNSEATMTKIMPEDFLNQRALKTFREISPTISRVFAGYHDWTQDAMDEFADYYNQTFKTCDCSLYLVPGRMPSHETHEEMEQYVKEVGERLEYCVKDLDMRLIRYYCVTNELSVGNTYAQLAGCLDKFKEYTRLLYHEFRKRGLDIGLTATDGAGISNFTQIDWATANMDEYVDTYCAHNYGVNKMSFDDPEFYKYIYDVYSKPVSAAKKKEKRFMLGEFGIHGPNAFASTTMISDVFSGFGNPEREAEDALMAAVEIIAAMNSGVLATVYWTMCDYPDPFLRDNGHTPEAQNRYETARFSGHGTSIRYNKNGLFRWSDEGDYTPRAFLYTLGLMAKFFRKNSRLMEAECNDEKIICGGVTNSDGSASLCIINLSDIQKEFALEVEACDKKPYRMYSYECNNPPINKFGDLQDFTPMTDSTVTLPPHSLVLLTTDYEDRTPSSVDGIMLAADKISWKPSGDAKHCYYRVYEDGQQIASTVSESINYPVKENGTYTVRAVDKYGNLGK